MLRSMKELRNYSINAIDGEIGKMHEFYFDDQNWHIRYMVVDVGGFLMREEVLLSPEAIKNVDATSIDVDLTKERIKKSPGIDTDKPVCFQHQANLHNYYGWVHYWNVANSAIGVVPPVYTRPPAFAGISAREEQQCDSHLRSSREVIGYHIQATDGEIGHVDDFIFDTDCMRVRYLIVDTKNWLPGKKVIVSPAWIDRITWAESKFIFDVNKAKIESSPDFNPEIPINREYEELLFDFYGKPKHWTTKE